MAGGLTRFSGADPLRSDIIHGAIVNGILSSPRQGLQSVDRETHDGAEQRVLVIVTTIPLEPGDKGYKKSLVERLSRAAHDHLADSKEAASFLLMSRLRDWSGAKA